MEKPLSKTDLLWPSNQAEGFFVGIDIGGSNIKVLVVNDEGQKRGQAVGPTDAATPERLVSTIEELVLDALSLNGLSRDAVAALGVGIPGRVNPYSGEVANAVNLGLDEPYPLGQMLEQQWQRPVYLENDGRLAALGAYRLDRGHEAVKHMAYVNIGTGISAGLVLNGRPYRGAKGLAGEIGHMIMVGDGEICACGLRGCLETVASGTAFTRLVLPLSVPAIASFAIFQFLWVWNDLLVALVFLGTNPEVTIVTSRLAAMVGTKGQEWHLLTAGAFVSMIIPLIIFLALQRYFVRGLLAGSVKG